MSSLADIKAILCVLAAIIAVQGSNLECKKKNVNLCLEGRERTYLKLCRAKDDGSRYDYETGIECLENVLSYCPEEKRTSAAAQAKRGILTLKICQAAYRCLRGEIVLQRLEACDVEYSKNAGMEFCELAQVDIDCQAVSSRACPEIYSLLWGVWNSTKTDIRHRCRNLILPSAGNIPEDARRRRETEDDANPKDVSTETTEETKLVCNKKEVKACVDNRKFEFMELCKMNEDGTAYDYDTAIECVDKVLSSCPTKYKERASQAATVISKLKVCKEAYSCVSGEPILRSLQACDKKFSDFSNNRHKPKAYSKDELCRLSQEEIDCQSASCRECPSVHSTLWDTWHTTAVEVYTKCDLLKLPSRNGGSVPAASVLSVLAVFVIVTLRTLC